MLDAACASGGRDEILAAVFLVERSRRALTSVPWERIERWLASVDNWETCDQIAMRLAAPRAAADVEARERLMSWACDSNRWARRFALATAAALQQKGRASPRIAIEVADRLAADTDPMVRKALAWALREVSRHDPEAVAALLRRHAERMHGPTLRAAAEKLPSPLRATIGDAVVAGRAAAAQTSEP